MLSMRVVVIVCILVSATKHVYCEQFEKLQLTLPVESYAFGAAIYNNELIIVNGVNSDKLHKTSLPLSSINTWSSTSNINPPITDITYDFQSSIQINDLLYGVNSNNLYIFDLVQYKYYDINTYNHTLFYVQSSSCLTVINSNLYVIGGQDNNYGVNTLEIYDIKLDSWSYGASINIERFGEGCASNTNNKFIYIFGGQQDYTTPLDNIEEYDISKNEWKLLNITLPTSSFFQCINIKDYIYCTAGFDENLQIYEPSIFIFDPNTLQFVTNHDIELSIGRAQTKLIYSITDNIIYGLGGFINNVGAIDVIDKGYAISQTIYSSVNTTNLAIATGTESTSSTSIFLIKSGTECDDGYKSYDIDGTLCVKCDENEAGIGGVCEQCYHGKQPNVDRTDCIFCNDDYIGVEGTCDIDCRSTNKISNELHTECIESQEYEAWYETSEFGAICTVIGILTGCPSLVAAIYHFVCRARKPERAASTSQNN